MNPKPGWVRNMANVFDMIEQINFLNDFKESRRLAASKVLQKEIAAFAAHYGQASTDECPSTGSLYVLLYNGNVLIRKENDDEEVEIAVGNLSIEEMEFLMEFMVDTLNHDLQYQNEAIDRYKNFCL